MKKPNKKIILKQKRINIYQLRKNIRNRNLESAFLEWARKHCQLTISLPKNIFLYEAGIRGQLLSSLKKIQKISNPQKPILLDFKKVKKLDAVSTNYFVHMLHKHSDLPMTGRVSNSNIVRSMFTKLNVHKTLGLPEYYCKHQKVNKWLMARGTSSDLTSEYDVIEKALLEKFGENEDFYVINEAIGEAVNNVIDHAYNQNDIHREWLIFLAIENNECNVVISDLGKTIPVSLPETVKDSIEAGIQNIFTVVQNFSVDEWKNIDDAKRIQLASLYRRTETKDKHRGKGFDNMMEVCKQVPEAQLYVYSRKGLWMMKHGKEDKMQSFKTSTKGTIIYWSIPISESLTNNLKKLAA